MNSDHVLLWRGRSRRGKGGKGWSREAFLEECSQPFQVSRLSIKGEDEEEHGEQSACSVVWLPSFPT